MECWLEQQQQGKVETSMSLFAERQAALIAQVLRGFIPGSETCLRLDQRLFPCDLPLIQQKQKFDSKCRRPVPNWGSAGGYGFTDGVWQECALASEPPGFKPLPYQAHDGSDYQIVVMPAHTVFRGMDEDDCHAQLCFPSWQAQSDLSEQCSSEPPAKRSRNGSFYTLDDIMKNLPRSAPALGLCTTARLNHDNILSLISIPPSPLFSSDLSFSPLSTFSVSSFSCSPVPSPNSDMDRQYLLPPLQNYRKQPYASVEPQSIAAHHKRTKIREKVCSLEKLIPLGSKLDTARMLEESIKYVKFLQAQVQVLECMPLLDSKANLNSNPSSAKDNVILCVRSSSNTCTSGGWNVSLTNALAHHRSGSNSASLKKKLSVQQMLHTLLNSPTIQRKLFSAGKFIGTVEQKEMLVAEQPALSSDFLKFQAD